MRASTHPTSSSLHHALFRCSAAIGVAIAFAIAGAATTRAQESAPSSSSTNSPKAEVVGRLGGDDVSVKNGLDFEIENGRSTAVVANGTDITVRSGQAKIDLVEGGDIEICGPAHLSLLKSPSRSIMAWCICKSAPARR
jgi:hypothetical protein